MNQLIKRKKQLINRKREALFKLLQSHPLLYAQLSVIRHRNDVRFLKMVANRDPLQIHISALGEINKGKVIYYIKYGKNTAGFFKLISDLLKYFDYADRLGFIPVVEWNEEVLYSEKSKPVCLGGEKENNPYEYFFLQPSNVSLEEARNSFGVVFSELIHIERDVDPIRGKTKRSGYTNDEEYINSLSQLFSKYVSLNEYTERFINDGIENLIHGEPSIGLHMRGTDYKNNYDKHPYYIGVEEYYSAVCDIMVTMERVGIVCKYLFVATDDSNMLKEFVDIYEKGIINVLNKPTIVYYSDVERACGTKSVAFLKSNRDDHHFKLGLEILRDVYTLANCEALVAGVSQVSLGARIVKKSLGFDYSSKEIIDKGFNDNRNVFVG